MAHINRSPDSVSTRRISSAIALTTIRKGSKVNNKMATARDVLGVNSQSLNTDDLFGTQGTSQSIVTQTNFYADAATQVNLVTVTNIGNDDESIFKCHLCSDLLTSLNCSASVSDLKLLPKTDNFWLVCNNCKHFNYKMQFDKIGNVGLELSSLALSESVHHQRLNSSFSSVDEKLINLDAKLTTIAKSLDKIADIPYPAILREPLYDARADSSSPTNVLDKRVFVNSRHINAQFKQEPFSTDTSSSNSKKFILKLDGITEQNLDLNQAQRNVGDSNMVTKVLRHLGINCNFINCRRNGSFIEQRTRSLQFEVLDEKIFIAILKAAKLLKNFEEGRIYLNRVLFGDEARQYSLLLKERWRLINAENVERKSIQIKHGQLFVNGILSIIDSSTDKNMLKSVKPNDLVKGQNNVTSSATLTKASLTTMQPKNSALRED